MVQRATVLLYNVQVYVSQFLTNKILGYGRGRRFHFNSVPGLVFLCPSLTSSSPTNRVNETVAETLFLVRYLWDPMGNAESHPKVPAFGVPLQNSLETSSQPNFITVSKVTAIAFRRSPAEGDTRVIWVIDLVSGDWKWSIHRRFHDIVQLKNAFQGLGRHIELEEFPPRHFFTGRWNRFDPYIIEERVNTLPTFLQDMANDVEFWKQSPKVWHFFACSYLSFDRRLGRKGMSI